MLDRLEAMGLLAEVVNHGSFSAAGRQLGIPLPTISRKIGELEAHLKTQLLVRTTRKLLLTDAGAAFLVAARRILKQTEEAERVASGEYALPRGELVVTAPVAFGRLHVLPLVNAFLADHSEISVHLALLDRNARLVDEQVDVAVRIGALPDSGLVATRAGRMPHVTCASPALLAAYGVPQTPADLIRLPCVAFDGVTDGSVWTFVAPDDRGDRGRTVRINPRLTVNSAEAAVDAAVAAVGVVHVLDYQAAAALAARTLTRILAAFEETPAPVSLLHVGQALLPLKTRVFLSFAAPRLRKILAATV
jgi:DNA-binding transcriptional LysR family regulator